MVSVNFDDFCMYTRATFDKTLIICFRLTAPLSKKHLLSLGNNCKFCWETVKFIYLFSGRPVSRLKH